MFSSLVCPTLTGGKMMTSYEQELARFIVEAKTNTYASQRGEVASLRKGSKDLEYRRDRFYYLDSYFGEKDFSGQEVVYLNDVAIWSMNYYGRMVQDDVPPGFIETLREALQKVEPDRPYRGCAQYVSRGFTYKCSSDGMIQSFLGEETMAYDQKEVYRLYFHGGQIRYH
jgi:hypothetical protein